MIRINKVMKVVKDHFFILALLAMFVGFSAFKTFEQQQSGWYSIIPDEEEPNDQSLQQIDSFESTSPPTDGDCEIDNEAEPCQVELDLTNFQSSIPIHQMTVSQAADSGAVVSQYANRLE